MTALEPDSPKTAKPAVPRTRMARVASSAPGRPCTRSSQSCRSGSARDGKPTSGKARRTCRRFRVLTFRRFDVSTLLCFLAAFAVGLHTQGAPAAGEGDEGIAVVINTVAVDAVHGRLLTMSLRDGAVVRQSALQRSVSPSESVPSGGELLIPTADIVRITTLGGQAMAAAGSRTGYKPVPHRDQRVSLATGDVLFGQVIETREDMVFIDTADLGSITVPLDVVTRIDTARAFLPAHREAVEWLDGAVEPASQPVSAGRLWEDRILLTNGDLLRGFVTSLNAAGLSIDTESGEMTVPQRLIVAVRFASVGSGAGSARDWDAGIGGATLRPAGKPVPHSRGDGQSARSTFANQQGGSLPYPVSDRLHFILRCRTSGRLTVTDLTWSGNVVEVRLPHGPRVSIEAERIVSVDVVGGRWEWLSSRRPLSYEHTPMLSLAWPWVNDRNVLGGPITVAGETYEHGVGVHSRSNLRYDLQGLYREFVTSFGIDDDSGPWADVSVFILVDGQRRFNQAGVRPGTLHGPIRLNVALAKRIELVVDFGKNGDLQDRFNWIDAALIRE